MCEMNTSAVNTILHRKSYQKRFDGIPGRHLASTHMALLFFFFCNHVEESCISLTLQYTTLSDADTHKHTRGPTGHTDRQSCSLMLNQRIDHSVNGSGHTSQMRASPLTHNTQHDCSFSRLKQTNKQTKPYGECLKTHRSIPFPIILSVYYYFFTKM